MFERLTVIGLGLIGGSFAMAVRELFPEVWIRGVDVDGDVLAYAIRNGVVDQVSRTVPDFYEPNHLVVIACHLSQGLAVLRQVAAAVADEPSVVVTDVGSCKRAICELGAQLLPKQFIGGHPMAGKEWSGIQQATSLLFAGKSYLLCPSEGVEPGLVAELERFLQQALRCVPRRLGADDHDRYMAYVSHLPQVYAVLLTNLLFEHEPGRLLQYHGGGMDDQLRLAASPVSMWGDIIEQNQDNLRQVLGELKGMIEAIEPVLGDSEALAQWFGRANMVHQAFLERKASPAAP
jgi:prephenate dehydrogenase